MREKIEEYIIPIISAIVGASVTALVMSENISLIVGIIIILIYVCCGFVYFISRSKL